MFQTLSPTNKSLQTFWLPLFTVTQNRALGSGSASRPQSCTIGQLLPTATRSSGRGPRGGDDTFLRVCCVLASEGDREVPTIGLLTEELSGEGRARTSQLVGGAAGVQRQFCPTTNLRRDFIWQFCMPENYTFSILPIRNLRNYEWL